MELVCLLMLALVGQAATVLRLSSLYRKATNDKILNKAEKVIEGVPVRPLVLGDSAYALLPWLN